MILKSIIIALKIIFDIYYGSIITILNYEHLLLTDYFRYIPDYHKLSAESILSPEWSIST